MVEFLVFNSVYWKKSVPSNGVNRVRRRLVEFQVFNLIYLKKSGPSNGINHVKASTSMLIVMMLLDDGHVVG